MSPAPPRPAYRSSPERLRSSRVVVLFCRAPRAEARVKGLPRRAADLFARILRAWERQARVARAQLLVVTPRAGAMAVRRHTPHAVIVHQSLGSVTTRLNDALVSARRLGGDAVVVAAGDTAPMAIGDLRRAFAHLESGSRSCVLAPAEDGGVNAIGVSRDVDGLFDGVDWMTDQVHVQLLRSGSRLNLRLLETGFCPDLDSRAGLETAARASRRRGSWEPYRVLLDELRAGFDRGIPWCVATRTAWTPAVVDTRGPPPCSIP